ncbi:hypothetical protein A2U01_0091087 [Trifolium medium]|uniref:Uncharacterized protein n=1 Tax=Trifolium medium TaxID=97028 RepID=A0A392UAJ2_9FABA|nr:hypothetical protein [Trifolium medium]
MRWSMPAGATADGDFPTTHDGLPVTGTVVGGGALAGGHRQPPFNI